MPDTKPEFRFDYKKYESKNISIDQLDKMFEHVTDPTTSTTQTIFKGIQLVFTMFYIFARRNLVNEKFDIAKQEYESGRSNQNAGDIGRDDLD